VSRITKKANGTCTNTSSIRSSYNIRKILDLSQTKLIRNRGVVFSIADGIASGEMFHSSHIFQQNILGKYRWSDWTQNLFRGLLYGWNNHNICEFSNI